MEKISPALLNLLLNATWQIALVGGVASIAARLLRTAPARYRHWVWVAALLLSIAMPLLTIARISPRQSKPSKNSSAIVMTPIDVGDEISASPISVSASRPHPAPRQEFALPVGFADALVALYCAFVLFRIAALARAWFLTRMIVRGATAAEFSAALERVIARCLQQTGVRSVRFLCSASIAAPLTVRSAPAVVVLPEKLLRESDEAILTSAIGHELVHVKRLDYLLNFLYRLLYIPLSFHPAAALITRRIDQTRELRCDEVVTECLLSPTAYARSLVELAGAAHAFRRPATIAVGIADADILEERIMSMLKKRRISSAKRTLLLATATLILAVPCIAAAPYAMHLNVATPAEVGVVATPNPVPVAQPDPQQQNAQPAQGSPDAARSDAGQEERAKVKAERETKMKIAFADAPQSGESQSQEQDIVRKKLEMERRLEEESLSPEQREARQKIEFEEMANRTRHLAELSKAAKITMQQAIEAALRQQQGTVMESSLMGDERRFTTRQPDGTFTTTSVGGPEVMYRVVILSGDENAPVRTIVLVNALDGTILKTAVE